MSEPDPLQAIAEAEGRPRRGGKTVLRRLSEFGQVL
jgi:hypothetical protein